MNKSKSMSADALTTVSRSAIACIAVGAGVFLLGIVLDWSGLWGGFGLGAAIGVILVGTYLWGFANGIRRAGPRATWLPSQDPEV